MKVRTPAGAKRFKQPIDSEVVVDGPGIPKGRTALARLTNIQNGQPSVPRPASGATASDKIKKLTKIRDARKAAESKAASKGASKGKNNPYVPKKGSVAEAPELEPLNNEQYQVHAQKIEDEVGKRFKTESTHKLYAEKRVDDDGEEYLEWDADRAKIHKEIVNEMWNAQNGDRVPNEGKGLIAGGLGGAGKSTTLAKHAGVDTRDYITANPDDVKEVMAKRGMTPEIDGLSPMETAALVHEESSHIAQMLADRAYAQKKNLIWDITMASPESTEARIKRMRDTGYTDVDAVFVDIPVETSVQRALARHRRGMEAHRSGKGEGGRYVPPSIIRENISDTHSSKNRATFEGLKSQFNSWGVWDNSGKAPEKVAGSGRWK